MLKIARNILTSLVMALFATTAMAAQHWGDFKKDGCTAVGKRQYSAVLWDIPFGQSWENACAAMPATINGTFFPVPARCKNTGQMWGEFDVPDDSCPHWGDWRKERCVGFSRGTGDNIYGYRQYSAILWDSQETKPDPDWRPGGQAEVWAAECSSEAVTLTADGKPYNFTRPHLCAAVDSRGVTMSIAAGVTILSFGTAAPFAFAVAKGAGDLYPLNMWGVVFIPDPSCHVNNSDVIPLSTGIEGIVK